MLASGPAVSRALEVRLLHLGPRVHRHVAFVPILLQKSLVISANSDSLALMRFGVKPEYLAADSAYGSVATLNWIVTEKNIAPHIPVIDKSKREDGTFSHKNFTFDNLDPVLPSEGGM